MKFPSEQEQTFILDYITLPLLLTVLERDRKVIDASPLKIKDPYLSLFESAISKVKRSIQNTLRTLRLHGITIYSQKRTDKGIELKYAYGYHHVMNLSWDLFKSKVTDMMSEFLKGTLLTSAHLFLS